MIALITSLALLVLSAPQDDPFNRPHHPEGADPARFRTDQPGRELVLPEEEDMFTFVIFGDRTGGPDEGIAVLAEAVKETNYFEPDMVMTVGDLVDGYNTTEPWMAQMREFHGVMDELLCPWFPVAGNHDVYWRGPNRPAEEHELHYQEHFGPLWYAFDHKDCRFIVLYTDEANPDTGDRNYTRPDCQQMSPEQMSWLTKTLDESKDMAHVFVFLHHPRWLGGNYGDDWARVHDALAEAGNVRACFAGHIHYMRHDGVKDGIEYVTLATVGGAQSSAVPEAGHLHQYHVVTVRPNGIAMAAIPVGGPIDVRALSGQAATSTRALANSIPAIKSTIELDALGQSSGTFDVYMNNPTSRPIEFELIPESDDSRWSFQPDHAHGKLEPGELEIVSFGAKRLPHALDASFRSPQLRLRRDYLGEEVRYTIPERALGISVAVELPQPELPVKNSALSLASSQQSVQVPANAIDFPDGPFTLETWFNADTITQRTGLICKTEGSEYGIFLSNGVPDFHAHLNSEYTIVTDPETKVTPGGMAPCCRCVRRSKRSALP